jgi:hypothetical protein
MMPLLPSIHDGNAESAVCARGSSFRSRCEDSVGLNPIAVERLAGAYGILHGGFVWSNLGAVTLTPPLFERRS